ncbi:MAG: carbamoyl-phosphate synthase large subunit [bacterium]
MPKRTDIQKILLIGSGPIIIGQGCEFDYSGTQACKALKEEGYKIVLVNSNPATIMTDPELSDRTYIEPIIPEILAKIIEKERPDALLPTIGGQTALNVTTQLVEKGILERYKVELIGANYQAIKKAEDRNLFKEAMKKIGLNVPKSGLAYNISEANRIATNLGFPLVIRPSFTLGGTGGSIVYNLEEFERLAIYGLESSMISEILIEESVLGWKEFELEVMRDLNDNVVIICSIENFDPMGIHTGDSITVAPAQTLTDKEYQQMRDAAIKIIREIGVETGGSNIQFALNPINGRIVVIEMNPRVSRSSALASKATGFPIARIAAKLAIGYTLDEIPNDITKKTPASFEPTIDYCVVKIPKFNFEKFKGTEDILGISMKSVGESMAIGRTFKEALQKGLRSLEAGKSGLDNTVRLDPALDRNHIQDIIKKKLITPHSERIFYIKYALQQGLTIEEVNRLTNIDCWFLKNISQIVNFENYLINTLKKGEGLNESNLRKAKEYGFSDRQLAKLAGSKEDEIRRLRNEFNCLPVYKAVDTCAAEFESYTPYYYSTYEKEDEILPSNKEKVIILGGGPNRIGQGIEFDYCCVHASFALKELGYETIMINSNPETVSTDYDTSDRLYFEPLTFEDVYNIIERERPMGIIVQFGGQTPLNLASDLKKAGVRILGTSTESIDEAEDRYRFKDFLDRLKLNQAENGIAISTSEAEEITNRIGFPVLMRPSYVLGGRAMRIVYDKDSLREFMTTAIEISEDRPILIDKFLEDAIEIDVDAVADGKDCVIAGIMEHIEEAGVHSGDSACVLPPFSLTDELIEVIKNNTYLLAKELKVIGLLNIQFAIKDDVVYVLEVNPRASRTVPFVSKATGISWAKIAAKVMVGKTIKELGIKEKFIEGYVAIKEAVFPFNRFSDAEINLEPEMHSTGEVMGIDSSFGIAFAKSQLAASQDLPLAGKVFITVKNKDKRSVVFIAKKLVDMGFEIVSTKGTAKVLRQNNINITQVFKIYEGRPNVIDLIKNREVGLIINTPIGKYPQEDEKKIRREAIQNNIPLITTISGASAVVNGIESLKKRGLEVKPLQEYYL